MKEQLIYLAGEWVRTSSVMEVREPFSGKIVASTWLAGEEEIEKAVMAAEAVKPVLAGMPSFQKYEALMGISAGIRSRRRELAELLCRESAKPMRYALAEIDRAAQTFLVAAEECKRIPDEYIRLDWTPAGKGREGLVRYFPAGIVAGIAPFNFPLNLAVHKIAPAMAAGCPIILKPASSTPLSCLALAEIIHETGWPSGGLSVLPANRMAGNRLVTHPRISVLSFTGSPEVGWKMKLEAGKKKTVLELGGNAGVIISENSDLRRAINACVSGGFAYSGQICIHAQRIYVQRNIFDQFLVAFTEQVKLLRSGDPLDESTDVSSMIDEANAIRVEQWIREAVDSGAVLCCGGTRSGNFVSPAVLTGTRPTMKVNCEEVFGPVVTVEPFDTFEEAVNLVNEGRFGLQAGVFTHDQREIDHAFLHLEVGGVIVNDVPTFRVDHMPYGGVKDSGLGREGVRYAMLDMMEPRILVK